MSLYFSVLSDLRRLRVAVAATGIVAKYDPNQPRVPAGDPDGGQWTSDGSFNGANDFQNSFSLAARRGRSAQYCM